VASWPQQQQTDRSLTRTFSRQSRGKRAERRQESRDKREEIMSRVGDSIHGIDDDKKKKEETREKRRERREEREDRRQTTTRREKREERRAKRAERRKTDPQRGRRRSPNEAAREGPTFFSAIPPPRGTSGGFEGRGKIAKKREKRK